MDFSNKVYLYFDAAALRDPGAENLMAMLANSHCQMILFVPNVWEEEAVKQLPAYGYICRTIYESDLSEVLKKDRGNRKQDTRKQIMFFTESAQEVEEVSIVHLQAYQDLHQVILEKL